MSNLAVAQQAQYPAFAMPEGELIEALRASLYPGAEDASIKMVVTWCKANGKDPFKRPVHIVPMSVKVRDQYVWRDVIMRGIEDYRIEAARTGEYAGIARIEYGPDLELEHGQSKTIYPEWCEVVVIRLMHGIKCEFTSGRVYWIETYATAKRDTKAPNAMWSKRPRGQLEKCAEAMALRRAFPEAVGGDNTVDEMAGRVIDITPTADEPTGMTSGVPMPTAKSAAAEPKPERKTPPPSNGNSGEDRPATDGERANIRLKLSAAEITEEEFTHHTGLTVDALTLHGFRDAKRFLANPADYVKPEAASADV